VQKFFDKSIKNKVTELTQDIMFSVFGNAEEDRMDGSEDEEARLAQS
jgi:hypothetical protein